MIEQNANACLASFMRSICQLAVAFRFWGYLIGDRRCHRPCAWGGSLIANNLPKDWRLRTLISHVRLRRLWSMSRRATHARSPPSIVLSLLKHTGRSNGRRKSFADARHFRSWTSKTEKSSPSVSCGQYNRRRPLDVRALVNQCVKGYCHVQQKSSLLG
jgi:hypothetical protein